MDDSMAVNRRVWDERAPAHATSVDYGVDRFAADPAYISDVVRFDLPLLGDVRGLRGIHLQCHIGTDTVSLSRLGARMTGLDFSPASIEQARRLATAAGAEIDFVVSDVHQALDILEPESFDLVFTGVGALCWLPSVTRWAEVVAGLLRPGGRLFLREGHPVLWALDEAASVDDLIVRYPYFETREPIVFDEPGTYVRTDEQFQHTVTHSWNHGLGETVTALLDAGLDITGLVEHRSLPWNPFPEGQMVLGGDGEWRLTRDPDRLPLSFTLQAVHPRGPQ